MTTIVGLSLLIAVRSRPFRSAGVQGVTISIPGRFQNMPSGLSLCCAAPPWSSPWLMWIVTGTSTLPPEDCRAGAISEAIDENAG